MSKDWRNFVELQSKDSNLCKKRCKHSKQQFNKLNRCDKKQRINGQQHRDSRRKSKFRSKESKIQSLVSKKLYKKQLCNLKMQEIKLQLKKLNRDLTELEQNNAFSI